MARLMKDVIDELVYEPPKPPKAQYFTYEHVLDSFEVEEFRRRPDYLQSFIKRRMAHALADHIMKECQVFKVPGMADLYRGVPIRMELTINDRGTYENLIPQAERVARSAGVKAGKDEVKRLIPYGFEPEQYYE